MRKLALAACAAALSLSLAACNVVIPNLFGGPPLVLTGNVQVDAQSWAAFSSSVKAGIANDEAKAQAFFMANCPSVASAAATVAATPASNISAAMGGAISTSAAQKQLNNASQALSVATDICAAGTTDSWVVAVNKVTAAFKTIVSWFK